jgi:hypothetical protein
VGGVSGRPTRETKRSDPLPSPRFATVEGTLVHGMPIAFAGGRWSVDLGRSVAVVWGSFPGGRSHRRQQVSSGRMRRGTSSAYARRTHSSWQTPNKRLHARGHVLRSVQRPVHVNRHLARSPAGQLVGPAAQADGKMPGGASRRKMRTSVARQSRYRGRANLRKQEEPAPGSRLFGRMRGSPRVSASRVKLVGVRLMRKKRKVVMAIVPARKRELGLSARTS